MAGNSSLWLLEQLLQPPPATRSAEHSLMMVTLTAKMCWNPQTAPGEDTGRQHCRMHRRKGAFERRRKEKSGKMSSRKQIFAFAEAFAQLSTGGASKSSCQHLQDTTCLVRAEPKAPIGGGGQIRGLYRI